MKTIKLEMTEDQAEIVKTALDAYNRAKLYQFDLWFETTFPEIFIDRNELEKLNSIFNNYIPLRRNTKSLKANESYNVFKTLEQYFAVKNNDGYFGFGVSFDGPLSKDYPKIEGFNPYKDILLSKKFLALLKDEKYELFWKSVDKEILPKYLISSWEKIEIIDNQILRVWKPKKDCT